VARVIRRKLKYQTKRRSRRMQLSTQEDAALHMASQAGDGGRRRRHSSPHWWVTVNRCTR
jgi:hypothetical protein